MSTIVKEFPQELLNSPAVKEGKHVAAHEYVMVDGERLCEVLGWNNVPTFWVMEQNRKVKEVEPWRIQKIEKED